MVEFETWAALVNGAETAVEFILKQDVAPVAEDILRAHIIHDIYEAYTPKQNGWVNNTTYERRRELPERVVSRLIRDGATQTSHLDTLAITSLATPSKPIVKGSTFTEDPIEGRYGGSFLALLESGRMGIWRGGFPRPAVTNAERDMKTNKAVRDAIRNGIKREMENKRW